MASLTNFNVPLTVTANKSAIALGKAMVNAWQKDGIFEISLTEQQSQIAKKAFHRSRAFFNKSLEDKTKLISDSTYSGYVSCQEEQTDGEPDFSEIFTVCKDIDVSDKAYQQGWPCHGPVPWPDAEYRNAMNAFMDMAGELGETMLKLIALGLDLPMDALTNFTKDGWHHMRVLRFQKATHTSRGIGAHTDYGLLVIAAQLGADGLDIRPPLAPDGEKEIRKKNWIPGQSMAGEYKSDAHWVRVPFHDNVLTVFPGDLLQYVTGDLLMATPHKVELHPEVERYALAYFHEPNFGCSLSPLLGSNIPDKVHYGKHFTDMFMRCYPQRLTTQKIISEGRYALLDQIKQP
jgi:isopenicillin N synthase-like dioxygenase